ncbi:MAG: flippase [Nitrospirae bacterium]|nr:flippase [Nitrospirota bacterium]
MIALLSYLTDKKLDSHLRELVSGSSTALIVTIGGVAAAYVFYLLLARNYGAEIAGIFVLSFTFFQIFSMLSKLGTDTFLIRFVAEYSSQNKWDSVRRVYSQALKIIVPFSILVTIITFVFAPHIARSLNKEYLMLHFRIISLAIIPMAVMSINAQALRGIKKIREFTFLQYAAPFAFGSLILMGFLLADKHAKMPIIAFTCGTYVAALLSFKWWWRNINRRVEGEISQPGFAIIDILRISLPMLLSGSMLYLMQWTDTVMLGIFMSDKDVGIYNIATKIATVISVPLFAVNSIAAPKFAEFFGKNDIKSLGKMAQHSTKMIFWVSLPVVCIFLTFPSFVMGIFGKDFIEGRYALIYLTIGQFINAVSGSVGFILQMTGKEKAFQYIMIFAVMLNIMLDYLLIPKLGIAGAAISNMIAMIFWNIAAVLCIKKYFNFYTVYMPFLKINK